METFKIPMFPFHGHPEVLATLLHLNIYKIEAQVILYKILERLDCVDFISENIRLSESLNNLYMIQKENLFGLIAINNNSVQVILQPEYIYVNPYKSGYCAALNKDFKWGLCDLHPESTNRIIIPFEYEDIKEPSEGICAVKNEGKYGFLFINDGSLYINYEYDNARKFKEGLCAVEKNGKWGYIDSLNNLVITYTFDVVGDFECGYAKIGSLKSVGRSNLLINHFGHMDHFKDRNFRRENFRENINIKSDSNFYWAEDIYGRFIIPYGKYKYLGPYKEGVMAASKDGENLIFIDINDNQAIPMVYQIEKNNQGDIYFENGFACVKNCQSSENKFKYELIDRYGYQAFPQKFPYIIRIDTNKGVFVMNKYCHDFFKKDTFSIVDVCNYANKLDMGYLINTEEEIEKETKIREERSFYEEFFIDDRLKQLYLFYEDFHIDDRLGELYSINDEGIECVSDDEGLESNVDDEYYYSNDYTWTSEDAWDAMTDGMYGDYPGDLNVDYDALGF